MGLSLNWSQTPKTGFLVMGLNSFAVLSFQGIYNNLREHQHQIESVNRHGGQFIREAKVIYVHITYFAVVC